MNVRSRLVAIAASALLAITILFVSTELRKARRIQKEILELSRMMTVRIIVASALSDYYKTNGSYPRLLEELPAGLYKWGAEGSSPADLKLFNFSSASNTFTLTWHRGTNSLFVGGHRAELYWTQQDFSALLPLKR